MYLIDSLFNNKAELYGNWYISRPLIPPFSIRLKDAWQVLIGNADAVMFMEETIKLPINNASNGLCPNCAIPFNQHNIACPESESETVQQEDLYSDKINKLLSYDQPVETYLKKRD